MLLNTKVIRRSRTIFIKLNYPRRKGEGNKGSILTYIDGYIKYFDFHTTHKIRKNKVLVIVLTNTVILHYNRKHRQINSIYPTP